MTDYLSITCTFFNNKPVFIISFLVIKVFLTKKLVDNWIFVRIYSMLFMNRLYDSAFMVTCKIS